MNLEPVIEIHDATVVWPSGDVAFDGLSWTTREGEVWAIVGPVGSGKSALTELLLGRLRATHGQVSWPLIDRLRAAGRPIEWPADVVGRVAFKESSRQFSYSRHYYQQRFNFIEPDDDLTLEAYLRSAPGVSDEAVERVSRRLGIADLRPLSFIKLSNGQTRRARIARAMLTHPEVLTLDEPFVGLDTAGQAEVEAMLRQLVAEGVRLILIAPADQLPDFVTHVLELADRKIVRAGPRTGKPRSEATARPVCDRHLELATTPIIELRGVNVAYGDKPILRDIDWTVRAGERWALLGPNGSGKSTLLSLLCGDHPQAYSNEIYLFGQRRGSGESIWDVKHRVGLVSPEMHFYFSEPLTANRAVATGFFDVLVSRPTSPDQDRRVDELFDFFGVRDLGPKPFARLSSGQQRLVLLIRALVKDPPLLILDEPFQVFDAQTATRARDWIDHRVGRDRTVLFVTHNEAELPASVTRRLRLREGAVVGLD